MDGSCYKMVTALVDFFLRTNFPLPTIPDSRKQSTSNITLPKYFTKFICPCHLTSPFSPLPRGYHRQLTPSQKRLHHPCRLLLLPRNRRPQPRRDGRHIPKNAFLARCRARRSR